MHLGKCVLDVLVRIFLDVERPFGFKIAVSIPIKRPSFAFVRQGLS